MKLVIGGAYQGKRAYAEEHDSIQKWTNGETCPEEEIFSCEGMVDFHLYLRRLLQDANGMREIKALPESEHTRSQCKVQVLLPPSVPLFLSSGTTPAATSRRQ